MKVLTFLLVFTFCGNLSFAHERVPFAHTDSDAFLTGISGLPAFDRVDLFALSGGMLHSGEQPDCSDPSMICRPGWAFRILAKRSLTGEAAATFGKLWRALKPGSGAGCYTPAHLFRFYANDQLIAEVEVCFHCRYAYVFGQGRTAIAGDDRAFRALSDFVNSNLPE